MSKEDEDTGTTTPTSASTPLHNEIKEIISFSYTEDLTPSKISRRLRQMANLGHALLANLARSASIDEKNAGFGAPVIQQIVTATANLDAAARGLDQSNVSRLVTGPQIPPPPSGIGRA